MFNKKNKNQPPTTRRQPAQSPRVNTFSYHARRSVVSFNTGRKEDVTPRQVYSRGLRNLPAVLSVVVIAGALLYATTLSTNPKVLIESDSTARRNAETYQQGIGAILSSSPFHYSKITISSDDIASRIESTYAELDDVTVSVPLLGRRPIIEATINPPAFIITSGTESHYIRSDGLAIAKVGEIGKVDVPLILDLSNLPVSSGKAALTKDSSEFITEVIGQFNAQKLTTDSLVLPTTPNELDVKPSGKSYRVKFNLLGNAREQVGAYLAVSQQLDKEGTNPKEYIDVRVEERVFYR